MGGRVELRSKPYDFGIQFTQYLLEEVVVPVHTNQQFYLLVESTVDEDLHKINLISCNIGC